MIKFDFEELCNKNLDLNYIILLITVILSSFKILILMKIIDQQQRFITLIDIIYGAFDDYHVNLSK